MKKPIEMKGEIMRVVFLSIVLAVLTGCANFRYDATAYNVNKDGKISKKISSEEIKAKIPYSPNLPVKVYQNDLPKGITLKGKGIVTSKSFDRKFSYVGEVTSKQAYWDSNMSTNRGMFWYIPLNDNHNSFRRTACAVQAPLKAITLGIWNIVPTNWPCWGRYSKSAENLELHHTELKRAARALDGDIVVIVSTKSKSSFLQTQDGYRVSAYKDEGIMKMTGFVFKRKANKK